MALPGLPRGVEEDLPAVGGSRSNVLCRSCVLDIGHKLDIDASILRTSFCRLVGRHFLILAKPGDIDLVSRNVELRRKVLYNGRRALLAEFVVVLRTAHRVSAANQLDYIAFGVRNVIAELIESF